MYAFFISSKTESFVLHERTEKNNAALEDVIKFIVLGISVKSGYFVHRHNKG